MSANTSKAVRVLVVVLLLVAAYAFGRYAQPAKVVVTEKIVTVEKQVVVTQTVTKTQVQVVKVRDTQKDVHKVEVTEKKADGTVTTTVTTDDKSKSQTNINKDATADTQTKTTDKTLITQTDDKKTVTTFGKPDWSLSIQPGFAFGDALGLGNGSSYNLLSKALPMAPHLMANIGVEHRFIGPIFLGAWANTRLDAGLSIRLEW
jgi:hypothetical protein